MTYRLLEITTFYSLYLEAFYKKHHDLESLDYDSHLNVLLSDGFAVSDFIHPELHKLGVESKIVIYNDEKLQKKWKAEFKKRLLFDIVCAQIKDFKPDVIYIGSISLFNAKQLEHIRTILNGKCKLVVFHSSNIDKYILNNFKNFDQAYTGSKYLLSLIQSRYPNVRLLYHAFDPSLLEQIKPQDRKNKLVFPGSIFIGGGIHNNRIDMLGQLYKRNIPFDFYGEIYGTFSPKTVRQFVKWLIEKQKPSAEMIQVEKTLRARMQPGVFGLDYYKVLGNYTLCLNRHPPMPTTGSGNMRMFEATGMGTCLLTDNRQENEDLFIPDEEIVVYKDCDELGEKAEYLISHPEIASEIAKRGQQRTLQTHSYKQKAEKLNEYILELL